MSKKHKPDWPPLVCTRCGGELWVELKDEGSFWSSYRVVDCIECADCGAEWTKIGDPQAVVWLKALEVGS